MQRTPHPVLVMLLGIAFGATTSAQAQEPPELSGDDVVCAQNPDGADVQLQCDPDDGVCLVADTRIASRGEQTERIAPALETCVRGEPGVYQRLERNGYEMIPARLSSPRGHVRDGRGRLIQTDFDLRRRGYVGLFSGLDLQLDETTSISHAPMVETGFVHQRYRPEDRQRTRWTILQGRYLQAPTELELLVVESETVDDADDPGFWLTTPFGEVRLEIPIRLGFGFTAGRINYRQTDQGSILLFDVAGAHINWEFFTSSRLENYALLRLGVGTGLRSLDHGDEIAWYAYPEVGLRTAWAFGSQELTHLGLDARFQPAVEAPTGDLWSVVEGGAFIEQLLLTVNDNPVTLFVQPEVRYDRLDFTSRRELDYRVFAGARFSALVPPRPSEQEQ